MMKTSPYTIIESEQNEKLVHNAWHPAWFSRAVLSTFMVVSAILIAGLQVVSWFSQHNNGIASTDERLYYLWTYGPSAVFTLVAAVYNRVDYRARQMAPWTDVAGKSGGLCEKNLFVDYISPMSPLILYQACQRHNFIVLASGVVVQMLVLTIVLSTGLFSTTQQIFEYSGIHFKTTTKLTSNPWSFGSDEVQLAAIIALGVDTLGLQYPVGTSASTIYQMFDYADSRPLTNAAYQAVVEAVEFAHNCTPATLNNNAWSYSWGYNGCTGNDSYITTNDGPDTPASICDMTAIADDCTISACPAFAATQDTHIGNWALFQPDTCLFANGTRNFNESRLLLGFGQAEQQGSLGKRPTNCIQANNRSIASMSPLQYKLWICDVDGYIYNANISYNATEFSRGASSIGESSLSTTRRPYFDQDSNHWNMINEVSLAIKAARHLVPFSSPVDLNVHTEASEIQYTMAEVFWVLSMMPNATLQELLSTDTYLDTAMHTWQSIMAQASHLGLIEEDDTQVDGTATVFLDRLVVRDTVLHAIQGLLSLALLLTLYMLIKSCPTYPLVQDPSRISGMLAFLAGTADLRQAFEGTGATSLSLLHRRFLAWHSRTTQLHPVKSAGSSVLSRHGTTTSQGCPSPWWVPFPLRILAKGIMAGLCVTFVVILQVTLAYSHKHNGLMYVSSNGNEHLLWTLIPGIVMTLIALYNKAVAAGFKVLSPWWQLRRVATAEKSISRNYLSMLDIEVLLCTLRSREIGVLAATTAAIVSALLTIVTSGVFYPLQIPLLTQISLPLNSWFDDWTLANTTAETRSGVVAGLILQANLSYPSFTYEEFAFADFTAQTEDTLSTTDADVLVVTLPAVRSALNCTIYNQDQFAEHSYIEHELNITVPPIQGCAAVDSFLYRFEPNVNRTSFGWSYQNTTGRESYCPSLWFIWGGIPYQQADQNLTIPYLRALACQESVEKLEVSLEMQLPQIAIIEGSVTPDESTRKTVSTTNMTLPSLPAIDSFTGTEVFFQVVQSYFGIHPNEFSSAQNTDVIVKSITKAHQIIRAQQFDLEFRRTDTPTIEQFSTPVNGTLREDNHFRLHQSTISTQILTALLLLIVLCLIVASLTLDPAHVVPKNPCSIAAMISLVADSNLINHGEAITQSELKDEVHESSVEIHSYKYFKLGWFWDKNAGKHVFTVNGVDKPGSLLEDEGEEMKHLRTSRPDE